MPFIVLEAVPVGTVGAALAGDSIMGVRVAEYELMVKEHGMLPLKHSHAPVLPPPRSTSRHSRRTLRRFPGNETDLQSN